MTVRQHALAGFSPRSFGIVLLLLLGLTTTDAAAQSPRAGSGKVVSVHELTLKPGVSPADFERFAVERFNPAWEGAVPGMECYIARADRGTRKARYAVVVVFDSERTRNAIVPVEGQGFSELFQPFLQPLFAGPWEELTTRWVEAERPFNDYVVLR